MYTTLFYTYLWYFSEGVEGLWVTDTDTHYTVYNCVWRELGVSRYRRVAVGVLYFSLTRPKLHFYRHWLPAEGLSVALVSVLLYNYNVIEKSITVDYQSYYNMKNHVRYSFGISYYTLCPYMYIRVYSILYICMFRGGATKFRSVNKNPFLFL